MSGHVSEVPSGLTSVVKNPYFTYIKGTGSEHRHAVQVWNVVEQGWTFHIYTGGTYDFSAKKETNTFHKKHLLTLGGAQTIAGKGQSVFTKRTTGIQAVNTSRNTRAGEMVTAIKGGLTTGTAKEQTTAARAKQGDIYLQKGYGNKLTASTLTIIDCSAFASGAEIGQQFAKTLARGATGVAPHSDEFVTGGVWHPTIDFERPCVYACPNGVLDPAAMSKAQVQVHLLSVDPTTHEVVCQVHHLSTGVA